MAKLSSSHIYGDLGVSRDVTVGGKIDIEGDVNSGGLIYEQTNRVATRTWTNNNADVPNADYADSAGNADTVDGEHAGAFANSGHTHDGRYYNEGQDLTGTSRVGGSGLFFDFDNSNSWIELVDGSGNRDQLVTGDVYGDGEWFSNHRASNNAHHSRYSDSEARTAVANGDSIPHPVYASKSNVPALNEGESAYVSGDGLYVEDGT